MTMSEDGRRFPPRDEVLRRLGDAERIHTFRDAGVALIGADWDREAILAAQEHGSPWEDSGPGATEMGHTLVFYDEHGPVFVAAGPAEGLSDLEDP